MNGNIDRSYTTKRDEKRKKWLNYDSMAKLFYTCSVPTKRVPVIYKYSRRTTRKKGNIPWP